MAAGAFVLAITGVLATKASKKFTAISTATFSFASPYTLATTTICLPSANFTTVSTAGPQVYIGLYTVGTGSPAIIAGVALSHSGSSVYVH